MRSVLDGTDPNIESADTHTVAAHHVGHVRIPIPLGPHRSDTQSWKREWGWDCLITFVVTACLLGAHEYLGHRPFGHDLKNFELATLHRWLTADTAAGSALTSRDASLPLVIDISPTGRPGNEPTRRDMLIDLVQTLHDMNAAAIGLDIDFSPLLDGNFVTTGDPKLFDTWVQMKNVRVGVFRRVGLAPEHWLGHPGFRTLAAGMMLPTDTTFAFMYNSPDQPGANAEPSLQTSNDCLGDYLLQMPAALYAVNHRTALCDHIRHAWKVIRSRDLLEGDGRMVHGQYVIDYSLVNQIKTVPYSQHGDLALFRDDIDGRVVFVGDLDDKSDSHLVPGRYDRLPGVLIHASAYATLTNGLLWHVDKMQNVGLNVCVLLAVFALSYLVHRRNGSQPSVNAHASEILFYGSLAVFVLVVSTFFIGVTRVFWPDFIWIAVALVLHPYAKQLASLIDRGLGGFVSAFVRRTSDAH